MFFTSKPNQIQRFHFMTKAFREKHFDSTDTYTIQRVWYYFQNDIWFCFHLLRIIRQTQHYLSDLFAIYVK